MKSIYYISILVFALFACKQQSNLVKDSSLMTTTYPKAMQSIFKAHGGLATWQSYRAMSFEFEKGGQMEKQFIDLSDRRERVEASNVTMGYDGSNFWMEADTSYKGNPMFYKNLMFYFYAMPFVLADDGIQYQEADPLRFDGVSYPGFRISYGDGVGLSPEDEYFIHYNPKTYQMEWLGYTVTFYSKERSKSIKWIRYDDWKTINGLVLPNSLAWYKTEDNMPIELRNRREFKNVKLNKGPFKDSMFSKTANAEIVTE